MKSNDYRNEIESTLEAMRKALKFAHQFERNKQTELAQKWGAVAANKLAVAVHRQYHVLEFKKWA